MSTAPASGDLIAERHRLGLDPLDEMWEGVLHMVPPASNEHGRLGYRLLVALHPAAESAGMEMRPDGTGVFDPSVRDCSSYRVPDLVVFAEPVGSERGVEGAAALVVEIASPGDESLAKIPFYSRVGVAEMLVVDRDTKAVRRWSASAGAGLVERPAHPDGWHRLDALAAAVRGVDGVVEVDTGGTIHRI